MAASKEEWKEKNYSFFCHKDCEYYPCHPVPEGMEFNCLFCYCPLYALGRNCGGSFTYTDSGFKDCSKCLLPHKRENYGYIIGRYGDILKAVSED